MNNVVSFETAKRLEAARFPELGWKEGIAIYSSTGDKYLIGEDVGSGYSIVDGWTVCSPETIEGTDIFAPSATDILNHLRGNYRLSCSNSGWWCDRAEELPDLADGFRIVECFNDKNPAEACAAAWLSTHEPRPQP